MGELQKRIKKAQQKWKDLGESEIAINEFVELDVLYIMEEAKKEFPWYNESLPPYLRYRAELKKWFEKWFGEKV